MMTGLKLCWFHLMPYTGLPDDSCHRQEWLAVDVDAGLFDPGLGHRLYNDYLDELEYADECGFDGICLNERHSKVGGLTPSPNILAGALARRARKSALMILGNALALYDPPTRVAEELAMLDCLCGGRLIAGFPVGAPEDGCFAYGRDPGTLRGRHREAHDLIMRAWKEQGAFAFNGRFYRQRYVNVWPRPLQQPHPPVWIPSGGSTETRRGCAEDDYVYCYMSYFGREAAREPLAGFWAELEALGKERNPFQAGCLQFVGVAETREEALRIYREPMEYFYNRCLPVGQRWSDPPGYTGEATLRARGELSGDLSLPLSGQASSLQQPTFEEAVGRGYVILGSGAEVADQLRELATELNVGNLLVMLQFGNMSKRNAIRNTELFSKYVIPRLSRVFADQWEHRWWPRPLPPHKRAVPGARHARDQGTR